MAEADTTPITPTIPAQGPVVFAAPPGGWSRDGLSRGHPRLYPGAGPRPADDHDASPHPRRSDAPGRAPGGQRPSWTGSAVIHREEQVLEQALDQVLEQAQHAINIVTSDAHDRATIVMT